MAENEIPPELIEARDNIDRIDGELIRLLAERFSQTAKVGEIKASLSLESMDPRRESQKIEKLRALSTELGLSPDLVEALFTSIMREVVMNHQRIKQAKQ